MHWIDPESLPEVRGTVRNFLLNPEGDVDGFVLGGRTLRQVHVPPHLSRHLARHVAPGDKVRIRGVKPRGADMIAAISLTTESARSSSMKARRPRVISPPNAPVRAGRWKPRGR